MTEAICLDPGLAIAHFQLGLLYLLYRNDPTAARSAWIKLDAIPGAEALSCFKRGLLGMADGDLEKVLVDIDQGMRLNASNAALNREMLKIRGRIQEMASAKRASTIETEESKRANQLLLNSYQKPSGSEPH